jgi:hypothetical protein
MPGESGVTVVTVTAGVAFFLPARLRARWAPGIPCALCIRGQDVSSKPRAKTRGEIADSHLDVIAKSASDEAIQLPSFPQESWIASLRSQ